MPSNIVFVFDGLQSGQVVPHLMPNLSDFAAEGVIFTNHHSVFPTVTRVNVSSMVTGLNAGNHGLAGNRLMIRNFAEDRAISAMQPELSRVTESGLPVLLGPTLGELLAKQGREYVAIGVGTNGNAYLQNPTAEHTGGVTIHPDFTLPGEIHEYLLARFGVWPNESLPNTSRLAHAIRILTEYVLPERNPAVTLVWSSEPDKSQHAAGVGSSLSDTSVKEADLQFGSLLRWLRESGRSDGTNVMAVSDHGYSTVIRPLDIEELLNKAGFASYGEPGGIIVAQNGGSALFYTPPGDQAITLRLANWLMQQSWCGTMTVSNMAGEIPGALPASLVGNQGPRAPELTVSFRWESSPNEAGYGGQVFSTDGKPGTGQHGSMSRHEIRSVMCASGPSFKSAIRLDTPSGNMDLTPTLLKILGLTGGDRMDGRVLEESLMDGPDPSRVAFSTHTHYAGLNEYQQQITVTQVGGTSYVDEGNGIG